MNQKYLNPDIINTLDNLHLKAKFIVEGFMTGLHKSPFHGFSVEFSEHRSYAPGDETKKFLLFLRTSMGIFFRIVKSF